MNDLSQPASRKTMSIISFIAIIFFLPFLIYASYQSVVWMSKAQEKPANITVDASLELEALPTDFYHAFSQGGEEPKDMLKVVQAEVRSLKPKLIRIDHIYDYFNIVSRVDNELQFDFKSLDEAVSTILRTGATPLLALSYMPSVIAQEGVIINAPKDWNDWAQVVQKTIEHYSGKNSMNIQNMYYEVWNEPDLAQFGKWHYSGEKNYLSLYEYASLGAKNAQNINKFFLGGPSTTGLYKNWILALVKYASSQKLRLDFISWHSYYPNPVQFQEEQKNLVSWLVRYPQYVLLPTLITEYGFTGDRDEKHSQNYSAAYTASVIRQLLSAHPTYIFTFQLKDGPGQESGSGWGLMTHEANGKEKKPRYFVFSFFDEMEGNRVRLEGEGTCVTAFATKKENTIRILLSNFDRRGEHSETVPITLTNLLPGTYLHSVKFLNGKESVRIVTVSETSFQTQLFMPKTSVALVRLTKQ